ncbi:MAG TPA: N-acyl homoserine lactonase family protein [Acidimicrobiales bacterium]|nr:N-acyl homoserine lactonase family protein [Acidimicrobiales bacterium]
MSQLSLADVIALHLADVTFPVTHPLRGQTGEVFAFALRHETGLLLYETGIGRGNERLDSYYQVVHRPIEAALQAYGHRVDDVRLVVNSHLHFDHCGNNTRFPGVPIYVQASEYEAARRPNYTVPEWVDFEGADYAVVEGDTQVASGVRVLSTPGHSPGHQSLVIDTTEGTVVLAGQAIYSKLEYEHIRMSGAVLEGDSPSDPAGYLASAARLFDLEPRRVFFSHDRSVWNANH